MPDVLDEQQPAPCGNAQQAHPEADTRARALDDICKLPRKHFPKKVEGQDLRSCSLTDINAKSVEFTDCNFSYSLIEGSYFHQATFRNCKFVGCRITHSNFRNATFLQCDFSYAEFSDTVVDAKQVALNLPYAPNIRSVGLRNLRANAASIGDYATQSFLVLQEVEANRDHDYKSLIGANTYYKQKYPSLLDKFAAARRLAAHYISAFVWGHGEKPYNIS
jgi:uncharacterized protein YjbI with pentapeptide repeats